jgi:hypothetical protein
MVLAYHGIDLPIANAGFFGNYGGAFVNTDTISDLTVSAQPHHLKISHTLGYP